MRNLIAAIALVLALLFSIICHFSYLDGRLPSSKKVLQVVGNSDEMQKWVPKMIEQRKRYYSMVNNLLDKNQPFQESYNQISRRWITPPFTIIPQETILDMMRNFIIGVNVSDEQHTMNAVSGLNPKKLDFVPGPLRHYGGFYYYTAGGFLMFGKLMGWLTLNPNVEYYFYHPEETSRMYQLIRAVGGVSVLATILLLFFMMNRFYNLKIAVLTILFFVVTPLMVPISHLTKAHLYGMFWTTMGLYFCGLILNNERNKNVFSHYCWAGITLGLSAGIIITNLLTLMILILAELIRQEWDVKKVLRNRNFGIAVLLFLLAYGLTNFYVYTEFSQFQRLIAAMNEYFPALTSFQVSTWPLYLKGFCSEQFHWSVIPLFILGFIIGIKRKEKLILLCCLTFLILFIPNLLVLRHPPVNARIIPIIVIICGWGSVFIFEYLNGWRKMLFSIYIFLSIMLSGLQCYYYKTLHKTPSNLDQAGAWINSNIPEGSSIGVWGGGISPFDFPAIRFLNYKMIHVPHLSEWDSYNIKLKDLPDYLILPASSNNKKSAFEKSMVLKQYYSNIKNWPSLDTLLGIQFSMSSWLNPGNGSIEILEKIKS